MAKTPAQSSRIDTPQQARAFAQSMLKDLNRMPLLRINGQLIPVHRDNMDLPTRLRAILNRNELYEHLSGDEIGDIRAAAEMLERFALEEVRRPSFRRKVEGLPPPKTTQRLGPMKPKDLAALLQGLEGKASRARKAWAFCEVLHEPVISGVDQGEDGSPVVRRKAGPIVQATVVMILEVPQRSSGKKGKRS